MLNLSYKCKTPKFLYRYYMLLSDGDYPTTDVRQLINTSALAKPLQHCWPLSCIVTWVFLVCVCVCVYLVIELSQSHSPPLTPPAVPLFLSKCNHLQRRLGKQKVKKKNLLPWLFVLLFNVVLMAAVCELCFFFACDAGMCVCVCTFSLTLIC